jgi:uncharacterized protein (TIGR03435 family)
MLMRSLGASIWLLLLWSSAQAQAGDSLTFEVASVKPSAPIEPGQPLFVGCKGGPGSKQDPGRWTCQNMTVTNMISMAWNLKRYQMTEQGTNVFVNARFDIAAKLPEGATAEQFRIMQQNMLKERFKLAIHFDKKEMSGYELVVAKGGPKLKPADPPKEDSAASPTFPPGPPATKKAIPCSPAARAE